MQSVQQRMNYSSKFKVELKKIIDNEIKRTKDAVLFESLPNCYDRNHIVILIKAVSKED